ncbi:MAG: YjbQ family protein [Acidobacteria bacterium]|nr:YjbQ family protein [Acidobacteriota bacterium]
MIEFSIRTERRVQLVEITGQVQSEISVRKWKEGICHIFCPHTTAGLCINENADLDVRRDLELAYQESVPKVRFQHAEGNSPAHFLSTFLGPSLCVFVRDGELQLGRWQGIFFGEMDGPRLRKVWLKWVSSESG